MKKKCHCGQPLSTRPYFPKRPMCDVHNRIAQMRVDARKRGKSVPHVATLERLFKDLGRDMICHRCHEPMVFYRSDDLLRVVSLQHEESGGCTLVCLSCNQAKYDDRARIPDGHKRCPRCGEVKPLQSFYPHKISRSGYSSWCKVCGRAASSKYAQMHREQYRSNALKWAAKQKARHG